MIFAFVFATSSVLAVAALLAFLYYRRRKNYESPNPLTGLCVRYVLKCMYSDSDKKVHSDLTKIYTHHCQISLLHGDVKSIKPPVCML